MDCENCGAPMTLYGDRDMFFCEFCGSFRFPSESSDGIRVLGLADVETACPVCHDQLLNASIDGLKGLHCNQCKGLLIDRLSFREVVEHRRMRAKGPPDPPRPLNRELLRRQVHCPLCTRIMNTHPYYGPGRVAIDTCSHCEIIWLDRAELGTIIGAPGRDRGGVMRPGEAHPEDGPSPMPDKGWWRLLGGRVLRGEPSGIRWWASGLDRGEQRQYRGVTVPLMSAVHCAWALEAQ